MGHTSLESICHPLPLFPYILSFPITNNMLKVTSGLAAWTCPWMLTQLRCRECCFVLSTWKGRENVLGLLFNMLYWCVLMKTVVWHGTRRSRVWDHSMTRCPLALSNLRTEKYNVKSNAIIDYSKQQYNDWASSVLSAQVASRRKLGLY